MEKLELKHIAPYLPYGLNGFLIEQKTDCFIIGASEDYVYTDAFFDEVYYTDIKPILRPLSDIKNFEDIMDEFSEYSWEVFENHFFVLGRTLNCFDSITYTIAELCFKHHIDLFGLIDKGFALKK
jgi:hypothetical protein